MRNAHSAGEFAFCNLDRRDKGIIGKNRLGNLRDYLRRIIFIDIDPSRTALNRAIASAWLLPSTEQLFISIISSPVELEELVISFKRHHLLFRIAFSPARSVPSSAACPEGKTVFTKIPIIPLGESLPPTMLNPRDFIPGPLKKSTVRIIQRPNPRKNENNYVVLVTSAIDMCVE